MNSKTGTALTPEQFDRLYLGPPNSVKGDLRQTFGNPTPLGIAGLLIAITPLTCQLMGWGGAYGGGQATVGSLFFLGGFCTMLASVGNFILGNTFPATFLGIYGGFFLSLALTLTPSSGAANTDVYPKGPEDPGFMAAFGFFAIFMGVFTFIVLLGALRTNLILVITFMMLCPTFVILGASKLYGAAGNTEKLHDLEQVAGALGFGSICPGWYLLAAEILASVDFPFQLPVFDLSAFVPGATDLSRRRAQPNSDLESGE
ncbi:putative GPR1/FUN34/YaaH-class plasma membrane protein [Drepanopeziza brunnea f. sp. 'multigermtubi' MB_m1]|uniref:Putative GPR1/FUN34/YaaH-class plasma membrane protein n=1 Tax=Marssonina brunnea f. sp. multigermtubi (strain MB_m1) TaxID=1072389 RepID=K1XL05_MARBU|nr:putative GPR1/FUN34/YaaH-class plasma membrane protein [Drepanopeziza brunnea f. sp. 'multigermtubi' MB_m1]EKD21268.1 putative GPR1/FUN34/YaaH-class plasma membrane protein [Drepanopeziza brunnea f. sp. 'multigermtubi' MB_m1]